MTYKTLTQFCAAASHLAAWLSHKVTTAHLTSNQHQQIHQDIHHTARCLEHIIHHHTAIDKHHLIYTHALLHLTCIFHYSSTSNGHQWWKEFFTQHHITPNSYTLTRTQQTPAVYIKLPFHHTTSHTYQQTGHQYIGSTNVGIYKREFNRQAKIKQLQQQKTPHVELAIRWWHTNHNYNHLCSQCTHIFPSMGTRTCTHSTAALTSQLPVHTTTPAQISVCLPHQTQQTTLLPNTYTATRLWRRVRRATASLLFRNCSYTTLSFAPTKTTKEYNNWFQSWEVTGAALPWKGDSRTSNVPYINADKCRMKPQIATWHGLMWCGRSWKLGSWIWKKCKHLLFWKGLHWHQRTKREWSLMQTARWKVHWPTSGWPKQWDSWEPVSFRIWLVPARMQRPRCTHRRRWALWQATDWDVYALWRLAQNVEQPERSRCLSELKNILNFRNCTIPKQNKHFPSWLTPPSAWLRRHIISQKDMAIPLHLATHRLREQAHLTINSILHNFMQWDTVKVDDLPPCRCSHSSNSIHKQHTTQDTLQQHLTPSPSHLISRNTNIATDSAQHILHGSATKTKSPAHSSNGSNTTGCPYKTPSTSPPSYTPTYTNNGINTNDTSPHIANFKYTKSFNSKDSSQHTLLSTTQTMRRADHAYFAPQTTWGDRRPHTLQTTTSHTRPHQQAAARDHPLMASQKVPLGNQSTVHIAARIHLPQRQEELDKRKNDHIIPQQHTRQTTTGSIHCTGYNSTPDMARRARQPHRTRRLGTDPQLIFTHSTRNQPLFDQWRPHRVLQQCPSWQTTQKPHNRQKHKQDVIAIDVSKQLGTLSTPYIQDRSDHLRGSLHTESSTLMTLLTSSTSAFNSASFKHWVTLGNKSKAQALAIRSHQS